MHTGHKMNGQLSWTRSIRRGSVHTATVDDVPFLRLGGHFGGLDIGHNIRKLEVKAIKDWKQNN